MIMVASERNVKKISIKILEKRKLLIFETWFQKNQILSVQRERERKRKKN